MENVKHTITVTLSESAQRAALLAGEPAAKEQTYEVSQELLPRLLAVPWTRVAYDGSVSCRVPERVGYSQYDIEHPESDFDWNRMHGYGSVCIPIDTRPADAQSAIGAAERSIETVREQLAQKQAAAAAKKADDESEYAQKAAQWTALPLAERANEHGVITTGYYNVNLQTRVPEAYAEAEREVERLRADKKYRAQAEAARNKQLERGLLTDYGTPDQIERYDAGMLPTEEFEHVAKKYLFAPLEEFPVYQSLTESDVAHADECYVGQPKFRSTDYTDSLDAEQFAKWKRINAAAPQGAIVELREHEAYCKVCEFSEVKRLGARVTITWAGEEYIREYAID